MTKNGIGLTPNSVAGAGSADAVDLVHLRRYTLGNLALEKEVLQLFAEQALVSLEQLRAAQPPEMRRLTAHSLKGSARAVGAWTVGRWAEQAEAVPQSSERGDDVLAGLEAAVSDACRFVARFVAAGGSA
jgi:HPt (histidine-containing phosphotransfer) domain-containing protein